MCVNTTGLVTAMVLAHGRPSTGRPRPVSHNAWHNQRSRTLRATTRGAHATTLVCVAMSSPSFLVCLPSAQGARGASDRTRLPHICITQSIDALLELTFRRFKPSGCTGPGRAEVR